MPTDPDAPTPVPGATSIPDDAAVVDRIEDGRHAVLLVGPDEVELVVAADRLPAATGEGDWVRLTLTRDDDLTAARRADAAARMDRIRRTRSSGRFD